MKKIKHLLETGICGISFTMEEIDSIARTSHVSDDTTPLVGDVANDTLSRIEDKKFADEEINKFAREYGLPELKKAS